MCFTIFWPSTKELKQGDQWHEKPEIPEKPEEPEKVRKFHLKSGKNA